MRAHNGVGSQSVNFKVPNLMSLVPCACLKPGCLVSSNVKWTITLATPLPESFRLGVKDDQGQHQGMMVARQ